MKKYNIVSLPDDEPYRYWKLYDDTYIIHYGEALDIFLGALPKRTRMVFMRRYWFADSISTIAATFGMRAACIPCLAVPASSSRTFWHSSISMCEAHRRRKDLL